MHTDSLIVPVVLALFAGASHADSGHVVVNISHGESTFSSPTDYSSLHGWGPAMDTLVNTGFTWSGNTDPLSDEALANSCLLIIAEPQSPFTSAEIEAVHSYVNAGGGLLLLTDYGSPMNSLSTTLGVQFSAVGRGFQTITNIVSGHPVTHGVSSIDWPNGSDLLVLDSSGTTELAYFGGRPVIAARQFGAGRIAFISDNELFAIYGIYDLDNAQLLRNLAGWLCNPDTDEDGVPNGDDACPGTPEGTTVDTSGCNCEQNISAACPATTSWDSPGACVSCISHAANACKSTGLIDATTHAALVRAAARSCTER